MSKNKYNIALLGGRGFVGQEIIKIIDNHKYFDLSLVYSSSKAGQKIDSYNKNPELKYSNLILSWCRSEVLYRVISMHPKQR